MCGASFQGGFQLSWSARVTITKYRRLGGLRSRHRFLMDRQSEVQDQGVGRLVPVESPFPGLADAHSFAVFTWWRENAGLFLFLSRPGDTVPS